MRSIFRRACSADPCCRSAVLPAIVKTSETESRTGTIPRSVLTLSGKDDRLKVQRRSHAGRTTRNEKLDLRLTRQAKSTLQAAASVSRRSVSQFVLESALARAEEALADRRIFTLNGPQWKAFVAALDAPLRRLPRLERLLTEPGFFDSRPKP